MKKYTVALVFTKQNSIGGLSVVLSHQTDISAENKNEAFGIAYEGAITKNKEYSLLSKSVLEQG